MQYTWKYPLIIRFILMGTLSLNIIGNNSLTTSSINSWVDEQIEEEPTHLQWEKAKSLYYSYCKGLNTGLIKLVDILKSRVKNDKIYFFSTITLINNTPNLITNNSKSNSYMPEWGLLMMSFLNDDIFHHEVHLVREQVAEQTIEQEKKDNIEPIKLQHAEQSSLILAWQNTLATYSVYLGGSLFPGIKLRVPWLYSFCLSFLFLCKGTIRKKCSADIQSIPNLFSIRNKLFFSPGMRINLITSWETPRVEEGEKTNITSNISFPICQISIDIYPPLSYSSKYSMRDWQFNLNFSFVHLRRGLINLFINKVNYKENFVVLPLLLII